MSLMATNERPLSCTCLPKLLTEHDIPLIVSENCPPSGFDDDEFNYTEPILSSSCPLPHGSHLHNSENQAFSANFIERLIDYKDYCRRQRISLTPQIFVTDAESKITDFKAIRTESLPTPHLAPHSDNNNEMPIQSLKTCSTNLLPITAINVHSMHANKLPLSEPNISIESKFTTKFQLLLDNNNQNPKCLASISNKPTNLPILLSDTSISLNNKQRFKSKSNASSASANNLTNINNTTIKPHRNIVKMHNSDTIDKSTQSTTRRSQRHSIAGQMGFFKIMDIAGGFSRKMATSTNSLFSTAVISGSSSAPNLHQINTASPSGIIENFESNIL